MGVTMNHQITNQTNQVQLKVDTVGTSTTNQPTNHCQDSRMHYTYRSVYYSRSSIVVVICVVCSTMVSHYYITAISPELLNIFQCSTSMECVSVHLSYKGVGVLGVQEGN